MNETFMHRKKYSIFIRILFGLTLIIATVNGLGADKTAPFKHSTIQT